MEYQHLLQSDKVCYFSTSHLLIHNFMKHSVQLMYGLLHADLDVCIGWFLDLGDLDERRSPFLWMLGTRGLSLFSGKDVWVQFVHNSFDHDKDKSPGILPLLLGWKALLWAYPMSHHFVFYTNDITERLVMTMRIEEDIISPYSLFSDHGNLEHTGGEGQRKYFLW